MKDCLIPTTEVRVAASPRRLMDFQDIPEIAALAACTPPSSMIQCSVRWGERSLVRDGETSITFPDIFTWHTEFLWKIFGYRREGRTDGAIFERQTADAQQAPVACSDTPRESVHSLLALRDLFVERLRAILKNIGTLDSYQEAEHSTYCLLACDEEDQTQRHTMNLMPVGSTDALWQQNAAYVSLSTNDHNIMTSYASSAMFFSMENIKLLKKLGQALDEQRIRYLYFMRNS
jgi:hypothetical protein